jgi:Major Facilitator Superfamily
MSTDTVPAGWRDLLWGPNGLPLAVICLGISLHAINIPLTATILPTAVTEIGGLELLSWAATTYLVASILTSVSGARLRRRLGNRGAYFAAAALFAAGSAVCALAPTMLVMLVGRAIQGAGGGLILALGYSLLRIVMPERFWAKAFALVSGVWGICAILGAFIGGLFADLWSWRGAYGVMLPLALLLVFLAQIGLPARSEDGGKSPGPYPYRRLLLIGCAILAVAASGNVAAPSWRVALILGALPLILLALRIDARAEHRLWPKGAFSIHGVVGNGLWLVFLMMLALYAFGVYGPILLQTLHGVPATVAGAFVAWSSISWTIGALVTASLKGLNERAILVAGPTMMLIGLLGLAAVMPAGPVWLVPVLVFCLGGGIGIGWAFLNKRVMAFAAAGDGEVAATSIPTTQMFGFAFGAALSGLVANAAGFAQGLTQETAARVSVWLFLSFAIAALLALLAAIRMTAQERAQLARAGAGA